jgi:hypothetical protein
MVVSRDTSDFEKARVPIVNPWQSMAEKQKVP